MIDRIKITEFEELKLLRHYLSDYIFLFIKNILFKIFFFIIKILTFLG
jgi:hypothetical protein